MQGIPPNIPLVVTRVPRAPHIPIVPELQDLFHDDTLFLNFLNLAHRCNRTEEGPLKCDSIPDGWAQ